MSPKLSWRVTLICVSSLLQQNKHDAKHGRRHKDWFDPKVCGKSFSKHQHNSSE